MEYSISTINPRTIAGLHKVGPWEITVKQGFEQLMQWVVVQRIRPLEWVTVYYDNPREVPAEKLRCTTAVTVETGFVLPPGNAEIMLSELVGGDYAIARTRVENRDSTAVWLSFMNSVSLNERYQFSPEICFELYHNDGYADGYWDIEMYIPLQRKTN